MSYMADLYDVDGLWDAFEAMACRQRDYGAGVDGITPVEFAKDAGRRIGSLAASLATGGYTPSHYKIVYQKKRSGDGLRETAGPIVADRIVAGRANTIMLPPLQPLLWPHAYGFRAGLGTSQAVRAAWDLIRTAGSPPPAGAWIETVPRRRTRMTTMVAPPAGAWIETASPIAAECRCAVAPSAGPVTSIEEGENANSRLRFCVCVFADCCAPMRRLREVGLGWVKLWTMEIAE